MKTLTTLTAVAALIAGISVASAADTSSMSKSKTTGASSMSEHADVIGSSQYCTKAKNGELMCNYASLQACQSGAHGADCVANPQTSTTGSGTNTK